MADLRVLTRSAHAGSPEREAARRKPVAGAILAVLVKDRAGVLCRVAELFSRRGYNIDSLSVGTSCEPGLSRMTIVTRGGEADIEQIMRQLEKLVEVVTVSRIHRSAGFFRELAILKVKATEATRPGILRTVWDYEARVLEDSADCITLEAVSDKEGIDGLVATLEPFGILELARTGAAALGKDSLEGTTRIKGDNHGNLVL